MQDFFHQQYLYNRSHPYFWKQHFGRLRVTSENYSRPPKKRDITINHQNLHDNVIITWLMMLLRWKMCHFSMIIHFLRKCRASITRLTPRLKCLEMVLQRHRGVLMKKGEVGQVGTMGLWGGRIISTARDPQWPRSMMTQTEVLQIRQMSFEVMSQNISK